MRQTFYEFCMLHERTNLLKEWDESRNFPLTPDAVSYGSKKKVRWTCENGHSWQTTVHVRSEGSGCPYCTGRKVLPGFNDLETLYPDVAAQWDREKNGRFRRATSPQARRSASGGAVRRGTRGSRPSLRARRGGTDVPCARARRSSRAKKALPTSSPRSPHSRISAKTGA